MKGLSIEEKAKAYDEAIEKVKELLDNVKKQGHIYFHIEDIENTFPELKESEDEKIRKVLIRFHKSTIDIDGIKGNEIVSWLERQGEQNLIKANSPQLGEQKTTDKVESKFHEGDWVILTAGELSTTLQIVSVDINKKLYWFNDSSYLPIVDEECLHHWTIQDAKGGDVLAFYCKYKDYEMVQVGIIEKYVGKHGGCSKTFKIYVGVNWENNLKIGEYMGCPDIRPATKEQRDTLERAMADAGYEWNAEKKVLKKLGQSEVTKMSDQEEIAEIPFGAKDSELQEATYYIPKGFHAEIDDDKVVIKKGEKPTAWSEEDEEYLRRAINATKDTYPMTAKWLKSLKQRIGG